MVWYQTPKNNSIIIIIFYNTDKNYWLSNFVILHNIHPSIHPDGTSSIRITKSRVSNPVVVRLLYYLNLRIGQYFPNTLYVYYRDKILQLKPLPTFNIPYVKTADTTAEVLLYHLYKDMKTTADTAANVQLAIIPK